VFRNTIKQLISHSMIYSLSWISGSAASILLLPVYTRYLAPTDYGILEMLAYTNDILRIIMIAGFHTGLSRFYHGEDREDRRRLVISTGFAFVVFSGLAGCNLGWVFSAELAELILGNNSYSFYIRLSLGILLLDMVVTITTTYFVVAKKPVYYIVYSLGRLVVSICANLYFIVALKLGAVGMLYGNLFSFSISTVIITSHTLTINGIKVDLGLLKRMVKFGTPMIPAMLCAAVMHNADRFLIRQLGNLADVGIYSLGYKFPWMLNALILDSFNRIWTGSTMYEVSGQADARYQYAKVATYFMLFYVFAQFSLSVFATAIIRIFAAPEYFSAHQVIPLVAMGVSFHALYVFFTMGAYIKDKTWLLSMSYVPAAAVNMAAAWMTVITYFVFSVIAYFSCKKTLDIPFEFRRLGLIFFYGIALYLVSTIFQYEHFIALCIKGICFSFLFLVVALFGGCVNKNERKQGVDMALRMFNSLKLRFTA
jgi:O-antigen/teichoic acid export membrane protein